MEEEQLDSITVAAGKKEVKGFVLEQGDTIAWSICPEQYEVGLEVIFKGKNGDVSAEPSKRISQLVRGTFTAESAGMCEVIFDNTAYWLYSTTVKYSIGVIKAANLS